jgi:hypothetical protein
MAEIGGLIEFHRNFLGPRAMSEEQSESEQGERARR